MEVLRVMPWLEMSAPCELIFQKVFTFTGSFKSSFSISKWLANLWMNYLPSQNTSLFSSWITVNPRFWRLKKLYKKTLFFREVCPRINNEHRQCLNCLLGITGAHKSQSPRQYVIWMHWEHLGITSHHFRLSLLKDTLPMQRCCEDFFLVHPLFCLHFG